MEDFPFDMTDHVATTQSKAEFKNCQNTHWTKNKTLTLLIQICMHNRKQKVTNAHHKYECAQQMLPMDSDVKKTDVADVAEK